MEETRVDSREREDVWAGVSAECGTSARGMETQVASGSELV